MTLLVTPAVLGAAPYRPTDDAQILERVAPAPLRPRAKPDLDTALRLAREHIERARVEGDPRWLGYAEGVLQPWWAQPKPPVAVRLLRATLYQSRHRFTEALADLDAVLRADPENIQAHLTRATVLRVQGRYAEAAQSCTHLIGRSDDFVATLCEVAVKGLSGQLSAALKDFQALRAFALTRPPALQAWHAAEWSEALERGGNTGEAEKIYRSALETGDDIGLRAAYADLLLSQNRAAEVERLLAGRERVDALALRLLIAQRALNKTDLPLQAAVAESFAAARRRGELPHLREEALFERGLVGHASRALQLAQENWMEQREPADTLLLARAAAAAGKLDTLTPLREWLRETGYEDARLHALLPP